MAEIRRAGEADLDALVALGQAMHAESPRYRDHSFSPEKVRALAVTLMAQPERAAVLVAEVDGEVVGVFTAFACARWFGDDVMVSDLAVYVVPEHRGSSLFFRLVKAAERWAASVGARDLEIGVSTGVQQDVTVRAYQRMGYTLSPTRILTKTTDHVHGS